jgi:hypothetical protein
LSSNDVKIQISVDAKTGQLKVLNQDLKSLDTNTTTNSTSIEKLKNKINTLGVALVGATAGVGGFVSAGIDLNTSSENATLAIASLISANADNVSTTGEALTAVEKYNLATKDTVNVLQSLKDINVQTAQTLGETTDIFKTIYGSVVNVGGSMEDVVELTKLLGLAASVSGVEFDSFISVVDGVADGSYDASSEFGKFLSTIELTPTAIQNSTDKIELIKSKLESFEPLGEVVQNSFDGIKSNLQNTWDDMLETATKPIFDEFKTSMGDVNTFLTQNSSTVVEYFQKSYYAIKPIFHLIQNGFGLIGLAIDTFKPSITQWANYFEYQGLRVVSFFESSLSSINSLGLDMASGWNDLLPDFAPKSLKIDTSGFEQSISQSDEKIKAFDISMNNLILENSELEKSLIATREEFVANQKQIDFGGYDKYIQSLKDAQKETIEVKKGVIDLENQVETSAKGELKIKKKVSQETKDFIKEEQQANRTKFEQAVYLRDEELKKHGNNATAKELIEKKFNKTVIGLYEAEQKEFEKTKLEEQKANKEFFDKYGVNINELEVDWSNTLTDITKTHDTSLNTDMRGDIEYFTNDSNGAVQKSLSDMDTNWSDTLGDIAGDFDTSLNTDMKKDIEYFTNDSNGAVQKSLGDMDTNWSDTLGDIAGDFDTSLNTTMNGYIKHFANGQDGATVTFLGDMENNWNTVMQDIADDYDKNLDEKMQNHMKDFITDTKSAISSSISGVFQGEFDSAEGFFSTFATNILSALGTLISNILAEKIVFAFASAWARGGNTGAGMVENLLGIDIPFLKFAEGTVWGDGKYGVVDGTAPFRGDDFRNDTIPALISSGEAVIPRTKVEANRPIIEQILSGQTVVQKYAYGNLDMATDQYGDYNKNTGLHHYGFFTKILHSIGDVVGDVGGAVTDVVKPAFEFVGEGLEAVMRPVALTIADSVDWTKEKIYDVLATLMDNPALGFLIQAALYSMGVPLTTLLQGGAFSAYTSLMTGGRGDLVSAFGIGGASAGVSYAINDFLAPAGTTYGGYDMVSDFANSDFYGSSNSYLQGGGSVKYGIESLAQVEAAQNLSFLESLSRMPEAILDQIVVDGQSFMTNVSNLTNPDYIKSGFDVANDESLWDALTNGAESQYNTYTDYIKSTDWTNVEKGLEFVVDKVVELGSDGVDYVKSFVDNPTKITDMILENKDKILGNITVKLLQSNNDPVMQTLKDAGMMTDSTPLNVGFSKGGFTGWGHDDQIAGVVHKNEVVFNHQDIQRHGGVANVESLRKGDGYDFAKLEERFDELIEINIQLLSTLKKQKRVMEMSA